MGAVAGGGGEGVAGEGESAPMAAAAHENPPGARVGLSSPSKGLKEV